jgi:hypothetical protein
MSKALKKAGRVKRGTGFDLQEKIPFAYRWNIRNDNLWITVIFNRKVSLLLFQMRKWINNILLIVAVLTIVGHNSLPHHHHDIIDAIAIHDHHDSEKACDHDDDHEQKKESHQNIFSFAQMDEEFVPKQYNKTYIDQPALYLHIPVLTEKFEPVRLISQCCFGYYREFPPPGKYLFNRFSRPPPSC